MDIIKLGTSIVTAASVLHTLLPPWEAFNDYPSIQKPYKVIVYIIGYAALNGRSTVYPSISTQSGAQPSDAAVATAAAKVDSQWKPTGAKGANKQ